MDAQMLREIIEILMEELKIEKDYKKIILVKLLLAELAKREAK